MSTTQIVLSLIALVVGTFVGGAIPLLGRWTRENLSLLLSFGSGVLLAVIFLQMIPPVLEIIGAWGGLAVLAGFILTSLLEAGFHAHRHTGGHQDKAAASPVRMTAWAVCIGLGVHSIFDGLALGTGMTLQQLAPTLFFAILLHKGPDAFALSTVLLVAGQQPRRILQIQGLFSLTTPLAAFLALTILRDLSRETIAVALGGASGTLLAVATEDLLPEVHRRGGRNFMASTLALLAGVGVVTVYSVLFHGD